MSSDDAVAQPAQNESGSEPGSEVRADRLLDRVDDSPRQPFRWKPGLIILVAGIALELFVWISFRSDATYQVMFSMPVVSGTVFLLLLWWTFFSGLAWAKRGGGLGLAAAGVGLFLVFFRFEEFEGDMWPRFRLRSTPTAEERLDRYLAETSLVPVATGSEVRAEDSGADGRSAPKIVPDSIDWPGFRGPNRDGVVPIDSRQFDWTKKPTELWRHPVGSGWSSFAVVDGLAFTQEQRDEDECIVCYRMSDGAPVWVHADAVRFEESMGGAGPRATPTVSDSRVFALGATGLLTCLEAATGKLLWQRDILSESGATNVRWAMSGSPLVVDGMVIANPGGPDGQALVAFDPETGQKLWSGGSNPASYSAPTIGTLLGTCQVLIFDSEGLAGHSIRTGNVLWNLAWTNDPKVNAAEPIVLDDDSVFIGSGYGVGSGLVQVSCNDDTWSAETTWTSRRFKLKFNAPVRVGDHVFGLDEGILACLNMRTGKQQWKRGRYGYGQLILVGDVIVVQAENGDVAFVQADPERYVELNRFSVLDGKSWNHPVLWNDRLLIRNAEEAVCLELKRKS